MFVVVRTDGKVWNGYSWGEKGKKFCTVGRATRSLHESGEDFEETEILPIEIGREEVFRDSSS